MQRAEVTDELAVMHDVGAASGMQCGVAAWDKSEMPAMTAEIEQRLDIALEVEEVAWLLAVAPLLGPDIADDDAGDAAGLFDLGQRLASLLVGLLVGLPGGQVVGGAKHQPGLEQANPCLLAIEVVAQGLDQARPDAGAHHR